MNFFFQPAHEMLLLVLNALTFRKNRKCGTIAKAAGATGKTVCDASKLGGGWAAKIGESAVYFFTPLSLFEWKTPKRMAIDLYEAFAFDMRSLFLVRWGKAEDSRKFGLFVRSQVDGR